MMNKTKNQITDFATNFIICEFNPLHFGHQYIIETARKNGPVICIMSGNFVQRGEPAIIDKWSRTRMALNSGANLVVELPLPFAMSGAEKFATGAVYIADSFGLGGNLYFGSEHGDTAELSKIAKYLLSENFSLALTDELKTSKETFAVTREKVVTRLLGEDYAALLGKPNNILGIEYIKSLIQLNSNIEPITVKRLGANHGETAKNSEFCSASEIRDTLHFSKDFKNLVPEFVTKEINRLYKDGHAPGNISYIERAILAKLRCMNKNDFSLLPDISEGIEMKLYHEVQSALSYADLCNKAKTKRYTMARIRRLILSAFLGITNDLPNLPKYIRILGMDKLGEELLSKSKPTLPFASTYASFDKLSTGAKSFFELEVKADDLYALSFPTPYPSGMDFTEKIIKIPN